MNKIKVKVVDYDIDSDSLIVAFAGDESKKSIDEYETIAYQPTMFDEPNNPEKVLEEIARSGLYIVKDQAKRDTFKEEEVLDKHYAALVGKEFEYDVDYLIESTNQVVEVQEIVVDDILTEILIDEDDD